MACRNMRRHPIRTWGTSRIWSRSISRFARASCRGGSVVSSSGGSKTIGASRRLLRCAQHLRLNFGFLHLDRALFLLRLRLGEMPFLVEEHLDHRQIQIEQQALVVDRAGLFGDERLLDDLLGVERRG